MFACVELVVVVAYAIIHAGGHLKPIDSRGLNKVGHQRFAAPHAVHGVMCMYSMWCVQRADTEVYSSVQLINGVQAQSLPSHWEVNYDMMTIQ